MKLKRMIALLLALCMIFAFAACSEDDDRDDDRKEKETTQEQETETTEEEETEPEETEPEETEPEETEPEETEPEETEPEAEGTSTPLLYKVSDDEGNVIWLFGSIHVGEEYFYPLPDYVNEAYESADSLAVECDVVAASLDLGTQMEMLQKMVYVNGTTISDHLTEELYTDAVEILEENNNYMSALDYYYPILWSQFIDNFIYAKVGADSNLGVDMHLLNRAYEDDKPIVEVESVQFQYEMLAGFSMELQILMLESSVEGYENLEEYGDELKSMMEAWAAGDEEGLVAKLNEEAEFETEEEKALYEEYNNALVVERNLSMTEFAEEALASGEEMFICVGAAHVMGEGAMADLLAERGYTVEVVE